MELNSEIFNEEIIPGIFRGGYVVREEGFCFRDWSGNAPLLESNDTCTSGPTCI